MNGSPLDLQLLFWLGPVPISAPVLVTWAIMIVIGGAAAWVTKRLSLHPSKAQALLEDRRRSDRRPGPGHHAGRALPPTGR